MFLLFNKVGLAKILSCIVTPLNLHNILVKHFSICPREYKNWWVLRKMACERLGPATTYMILYKRNCYLYYGSFAAYNNTSSTVISRHNLTRKEEALIQEIMEHCRKNNQEFDTNTVGENSTTSQARHLQQFALWNAIPLSPRLKSNRP